MADVHLFENDERDYMQWLASNPQGYVLNLGRPPNKNYLMLHRVTCGDISQAQPKRGPEQFTGGQYNKLCGSSHESITLWLRQNISGVLSFTHLCRRCRPDAPIDQAASLQFEFLKEVVKAKRDSATARTERLCRANTKPAVRFVMTMVFDRNPDVVAEVLSRAQGKCERCGDLAPFISRATRLPYLEVHHKVKLADYGDDTVENAIALCPNCHRGQHYGLTTDPKVIRQPK
jgi:5-methylcytosine-specific restriction endonuclease McrA